MVLRYIKRSVAQAGICLPGLVIALMMAGCGDGASRQPVFTPQAPGGDQQGAATPVANVYGPFPIALPSQVYAKLRGVKQVSSILTRDASDYVDGYSQRVNPITPEAIYGPAWESGYSPFDTVSYAIYRFDLTARTGKLGINTLWTQGMVDKKLLWIGASNWQKDRWDWNNGAPAGIADTGTEGMALYKHPDTSEMYVAVVVLGLGAAKLNRIWLTCSLRGDWWMDGRNATHHACSPFIGPDQPSLLWSRRLLKATNAGQPVCDANGGLYVQAYGYTSDGSTLFALNPDGSDKWQATLPRVNGGVSHGASDCPAVGDDGTLYCAVTRGPLYAVNQDGDIEWSFAGHLNIFGYPAIGPGGVIYVGGLEHVVDQTEIYLHALNPDGSLRWEYAFGEKDVASSPAIGIDGTIYISADNVVYAIKQDGGLAWSYTAPTGVRFGQPGIGANGQIYISNDEPKLYVLTPAGELSGAFSMAEDIGHELALGLAGDVYAGQYSGHALALNADGTTRWSYFVAGGGHAVLDAAGNVYVASTDSRLYAIGLDGVLKWWFVFSDAFNAAPCIGEDGSLYAVNSDGMIYAFGPGSQVDEHAISGYVKDEYDQGLSGVLVTITGEEPVITGADGGWRKEGLADGEYLVSPALDGFDFTPFFQQVVVSGGDVAVSDFIGTLIAPPVWPMFGLNRAHTRCSPYAGPATEALRWVAELSVQDFRSEPLIGGDGVIIVQSQTGMVTAIAPDGAIRWSHDLGFPCVGTPVLASDGVLFTAGDNQLLKAYTPGGIFMWAYSIWANSSPLLLDDNVILVNDGRYINELYCDGKLKAQYSYPIEQPGGALPVAPGMAPDGTLYITTGSYLTATPGTLVALSPDGSTKWVISVDPGAGYAVSSPAVGADGTVYLGCGKYLYAFNPAGTQLWSYYTTDTDGDSVKGSPSIAGDGTICFAKGNINIQSTNKLVALNPDGSLKWEYDAGGYAFTGCPTVDTNGVVYSGVRGLGEMRALNPDGTLKWTFDTQADPTPAVLGADGTVYFADSIGKVYAIGPGGG